MTTGCDLVEYYRWQLQLKNRNVFITLQSRRNASRFVLMRFIERCIRCCLTSISWYPDVLVPIYVLMTGLHRYSYGHIFSEVCTSGVLVLIAINGLSEVCLTT